MVDVSLSIHPVQHLLRRFVNRLFLLPFVAFLPLPPLKNHQIVIFEKLFKSDVVAIQLIQPFYLIKAGQSFQVLKIVLFQLFGR